MIDWLIVGGGVHGVSVAVRLREGGWPADAIRILDPHPEPLACWRRRAASVEMGEMRSPAVHHLHPEPSSLMRYAHATGRALEGGRIPPALDLFERHATDVIDRAGVPSLVVCGVARRLSRIPTGSWLVETDAGPWEARRVVLAIGSVERSEWPAWAHGLRQRGAAVSHVFDRGFRPAKSGAVAVVGGGLSAAHVALAAFERGQPVTWVVRRPPRITDYDADWSWFSGEAMVGFHELRDLRERRALLERSRHRGSVPPAVARRLEVAIAGGAITLVESPLVRATAWPGRVRLGFVGRNVDVQHVVLATGFARGVPGEAWLGPSAKALGLPRAPCGFPVVDRSLRWAEGLYVCGALGELELGPIARSIAGGQRAAALIERGPT